MSTSENAYAYFRVAAEELPIEEISSLLEMSPTESWRKGDPGQYNPSRPDSGWILYSPLPRSNVSIDEHVELLLPILENHAKEVRALSDRFDTYLICVGFYNGSNTGFFLSKSVVKRIAALGLSIDCNLYCNRGDED